MREYQSNSHRNKELQASESTLPEKKVEKVVSGKVTTRENKARKFTDIFISEDAANVKSYIFMDVLVPAIKKAISDIVTDGIDMILYGGTGRSGRKSSGAKVNYRSYSDDRYSNDRRETSSYESRKRFDCDDLVFETRADAEKVRRQMFDIIKRYGVVTVADMYEMATDDLPPYTSCNFGWMNARAFETAEPRRVRDGYILELPKPSPID